MCVRSDFVGSELLREAVLAWGRHRGAQRRIFSQNHCARKKENGAIAKTVPAHVAGCQQWFATRE